MDELGSAIFQLVFFLSLIAGKIQYFINCSVGDEIPCNIYFQLNLFFGIISISVIIILKLNGYFNNLWFVCSTGQRPQNKQIIPNTTYFFFNQHTLKVQGKVQIYNDQQLDGSEHYEWIPLIHTLGKLLQAEIQLFLQPTKRVFLCKYFTNLASYQLLALAYRKTSVYGISI